MYLDHHIIVRMAQIFENIDLNVILLDSDGCVILPEGDKRVFNLPEAFKKNAKEPKKIGNAVYPIALVGGFSDSIGGGGWGPVVTSTLVAADCDVRTTIGSVNAAEFFVTLAESAAFILTLGSVADYLPAVGGLIFGGIIVAPFSAYLCKKVPVKPLIAVLGVLIVAVNTWKFVTAIMG